MAKRRNVGSKASKGKSAATTDGHERGNYLVRRRPLTQASPTCIRTPSATPAATTWPTKEPICVRSRTILAIGIHAIRYIIRAWPADASKGCGSRQPAV